MELTDILSLEKWIDLEKEINEKSGLNAAVFNKDGFRITDYTRWANRLCPVIKASKEGQTSICSLANWNLMTQAKRTRKPVIGECDAGFIKVVVPIYAGDEFLGSAGGCGLLLDHGEVELFLIGRITGLSEEKIESLSRDIHKIAMGEAASVVNHIEERINSIVDNFHKRMSWRNKEERHQKNTSRLRVRERYPKIQRAYPLRKELKQCG